MTSCLGWNLWILTSSTDDPAPPVDVMLWLLPLRLLSPSLVDTNKAPSASIALLQPSPWIRSRSSSLSVVSSSCVRMGGFLRWGPGTGHMTCSRPQLLFSAEQLGFRRGRPGEAGPSAGGAGPSADISSSTCSSACWLVHTWVPEVTWSVLGGLKTR